MAKADFYILNKSDHSERLKFLCRLAEKAIRLGHTIYIHTNNQEQATEIDDFLWTYKIESFLPHDQNTTDKDSFTNNSLNTNDSTDSFNGTSLTAPITIGCSDNCGTHNDLLINLASELPRFYKTFNRIAEIVIQNDIILNELRSHYREIQKEGIEAVIHDFRVSR